jgi:transposase
MIHALADSESRPIRFKLTKGQAHEGRSVADMSRPPRLFLRFGEKQK